MANVYHLDLNGKKTGGARIALLPGDPARVPLIAAFISQEFGSVALELASKREFRTILTRIKDSSILITSTGIGGPSASIAIDELAQLGVTTFIRVGTTGAIQPHIGIGDCVITTGAVRLDGASTHYAPIEYPAVAHYGVVSALIEGAVKANVPYHTGVTASSDTFYPGEERTDSFRRYVIKGLKGSREEWKRLNVLNYEMESSTVLTLTASMNLKGGCVTGVVNRGGTGRITEKSLKIGAANAVRTAVYAVESLVSK